MTLKTLLKVILRCFSVVLLFNCTVAGVRLLSFALLSPDAREMRYDEVSIELVRSALGLVFGVGLFRFADRLISVLGKGFDFGERLEVIRPDSMIAAIYAIFGVWLVAFSIPDLIEEIIRLQTSYYGAAVNDKHTAILKYSIAGDISRILIGILLIKFRKWLPPLNKVAEGA